MKLGDGRVVDDLGIGTVKMKIIFKMSDAKNVTMYDVLYVPKLMVIYSQWELLPKEETRCSSGSLAATYVEQMELFKEWEHKELTGYISWMLKEVHLSVIVHK